MLARIVMSAALLAVVTALPARAENADAGPTRLSPQQIGEIFCIARVGNDMAPIEAIITPSLKKAIAKAEALDAAWEKKNPGEKPPLGDGLPWQSSADYTPDCTIANPMAGAREARVEVTYGFPDAPGADTTDTLLLKPAPNPEMGDDVWRIADIIFAGKSGMRQEMLDAFKP